MGWDDLIDLGLDLAGGLLDHHDTPTYGFDALVVSRREDQVSPSGAGVICCIWHASPEKKGGTGARNATFPAWNRAPVHTSR